MKNQTRFGMKKLPLFLIVGGIAIVLIAVVCIVLLATGKEKSEPEVFTVSTLEKIINISELSTYTAVYNGIAEVEDEKKEEKVEYYVSYEAQVNAGIDLEKIDISLDQETKTITITLPEVYITDTKVKIDSLDFIFVNDKANKSAVTEEAFKACENDVKQESEQQPVIKDLAKQNAVSMLTALINPIIKQLDEKYTLEIG